MEVRSQKDKQQLSSNDSSTFSCRSLKLGVYSKSRLKSNSSSSSKNNPSPKCNMISSIKRKIKINNIEILSKSNQKRFSDPYQPKNDMTFSCYPESTSTRPTINFQNYLQFDQLQRKANSHENLIFQNIHNLRGQKLACFDDNCQIKRKWIRSILFYEKQLKNLYLLKQRRGLLPPEINGQIQKDVTRTYSKNVVYNTKINLIQNEVDKYNLIDILRNVLKLYAAYDQQVGYVQGMNLLAAPIVFHMKEANSAFIYFKEVMNYGKLRLFYVDNFDNIKQQLRQRFKKVLRFYNYQLFDYFEQQDIDYTIFVPYYFSLFASLIDIQYMHIVINQFMRSGIAFLHKLLLSLLLFLKNRIIEDKQEEGLMMKLGTSYLKSLHINWKLIIHATQLISLP